MSHSTIVGGSTAKRVMRCPGSVALVAQMPPRPASEHAKIGTLLHDVIAQVLGEDRNPEDFLGVAYDGVVFTQELLDEKIKPALAALEKAGLVQGRSGAGAGGPCAGLEAALEQVGLVQG